MTTLTLTSINPKPAPQGPGAPVVDSQVGARCTNLPGVPMADLSRSVPVSSLLRSRLTPRWHFDERTLNALAASIREHGVLEPLIVREVFGFGAPRFEVVKGERRFRAALIAGLTEVPVTVRHLSDAEARQVWLAKTIHRANISVVEHSEAIMHLLQSALGLDQPHVRALLLKMHVEQCERGHLRWLLEGYAGHVLAERVELVLGIFDAVGGLGFQGFVSDRLPIFDLPGPMLNALRDGAITLEEALLLKGLDASRAEALLEQHRQDKWTHAQLRRAIRSDAVEPDHVTRLERIGKVLAKQKVIGSDVDALICQLETALGLPAMH